MRAGFSLLTNALDAPLCRGEEERARFACGCIQVGPFRAHCAGRCGKNYVPVCELSFAAPFRVLCRLVWRHDLDSCERAQSEEIEKTPLGQPTTRPRTPTDLHIFN